MLDDRTPSTNGESRGLLQACLDDSRLMYAFAHDLRTHLRTVLTRIQLVQRGSGAALPEQDQALLREAATAAAEMDTLIGSMAAYCDANPGDAVMDLRLLLHGALLERKAGLKQAGAEVEVNNDLSVPAPRALQGVLKELLTNACKFRDPSRPLRIRISTRLLPGNILEIEVADNGTGLNPAEIDKIFLPFHRMHPRETFPGHGLGLATSRRLAAAWGGAVRAEVPPGHGLRVLVTAPVQPA
jgi:signal transduction histidine kinase